MATQPHTGLVYDDLQAFPEDNFRREIIDGELIVTAAPSTRHQEVVARVCARLLLHAEENGGRVYPAPTDVFFTEADVVEPDVVFVGESNIAKVEEKFVRSAPDVVVEVSSPSTRRLELMRKRDLYERFEVPEYWYVDLDAERIELYRLSEGRYGVPVLLQTGDALTSPQVPGFSLPVGYILGPVPGEPANSSSQP